MSKLHQVKEHQAVFFSYIWNRRYQIDQNLDCIRSSTEISIVEEIPSYPYGFQSEDQYTHEEYQDVFL